MRLLMATCHTILDPLLFKLESEAGIKELERILEYDGLSSWAKPILIVSEVKYRGRLIEQAKATKPDVVLLYDKLRGEEELSVLLEELRTEVKNEQGQDTRVIFLTSLEQGEPLLRKAVELGIWDIISGSDISPVEIIKHIYKPANFSDAARYKLAPELKEEPLRRLNQAQTEVKEKVVIKEVQNLVIREVKEVKKQIVSVWWSASGGEGKTTLAASQAYQLARNTGEKVALLDFKEANPACNYWFNVPQKDTLEIIDAIEKGTLNQSIIEENLVIYPKLENLKIFTGVDLFRMESWGAEYFDKIQRTLNYPYIIIDTNPGLFFSGTVSALQSGADTINVVVEPTYKSISETTRWLEFMQNKWGIPADNFTIHFNKLSFRTLDGDTLKKAFEKYKIGGIFQYSDSVIELLNKGTPATKGFEKLLDNTIFTSVDKKKSGFLSFLKR